MGADVGGTRATPPRGGSREAPRGSGGRRTPRVGIEPFAPERGASFVVDPDAAEAEPRPLVEHERWRTHRAPPGIAPPRVAFVDGVRRADARLSLEVDGRGPVPGLAGAFGVGAACCDPGEDRARIDHARIDRLVVAGGGHVLELPALGGGWAWRAVSVPDTAPDAPLRELQDRMRQAESSLAQRLADDGWLVVLDGPLSYVRSTDLPLLGYVKTHHRPLLEPDLWARVPDLHVGERSPLLQLRPDQLACYLRIGAPGRLASAWGGIVRLDVPAAAGLDRAVRVADAAAGWLPRFASAAHRDPRAPVNLTPVGALERHLTHLLAPAPLALRAVTRAVDVLRRQTLAGDRRDVAGLATPGADRDVAGARP